MIFLFFSTGGRFVQVRAIFVEVIMRNISVKTFVFGSGDV